MNFYKLRKCDSWKLLFVFLLFVLCSNAFASENTNSTDNVSVVNYLQEVEEKFDVEFSYSVSIWKDYHVSFNDNLDNLEEVLDQLQNDLPLSFKEMNDNVFVVLPESSTIKIKVVDSQSGDAIPLVYLASKNNKKRLFYANKEYFNFEDVLPSDEIIIDATFFESKSIPVSSYYNGENEIVLESKVHDISEVLVLPAFMTRGIDCIMNDASIRINIQDLSSIAGETDGDVFQVVNALPGISSPTGKPGSLIIRGSQSDLNLLQFDDIPIYHIGHLFGAFSAFNSKSIQNINVNRNQVPVEYGGKAGSLISLTTKSDIVDSLEYGLLANLVYSGLDIRLPLIDDKLGLSIAVRKSLPFLQNSPKYSAISTLTNQGGMASEILTSLEGNSATIDEGFLDINAKVIYKPNSKDIFSLSSIVIENNSEIIVTQKDNQIEKIKNQNINNFGITGKWNRKYSNELNTELSTTYSSFSIDDRIMQTTNEIALFRADERTINDFKIKASLDYCFNANHKIRAGVNSIAQTMLTFSDNMASTMTSSDTTAFISSIYARYESLIGKKLMFNLGSRINYFSLTQSFSPDINANLNYLINKNLFLKSSYSQVNQFMSVFWKEDFEENNAFKQYWRFAQSKDEIIVGKQLMAGATFEKEAWLVDIEAYSKTMNNIAVQIKGNGIDLPQNPPDTQNGPPKGGFPDGSPPPNGGSQNNPLPSGIFEELIISQFVAKETASQITTTDLYTTGIDFLVKKRWNQIDTWISYTLSKTTINENSDPVYYDRLHDINITTIIPYKDWTFSLNWNYATGLPVLPINFKGITAEEALIEMDYEGRYPAVHQLDLSVTRKIFKKSKRLEGVIGLSVMNLYNRNNIVNNFANVELYNEIYRYGLGFAPNLQIDLRFK